MDDVVFIDANVFMYAAGAPHPYKSPCIRILSYIETGALKAVINTEIVQELLYRYRHINMADKGVQLARDVLGYPLSVLSVTEADVRLAIELFAQYHSVGVQPRDSIHAATMQSNGISRLISADRDFDHLDFLTRIDPRDSTALVER